MDALANGLGRVAVMLKVGDVVRPVAWLSAARRRGTVVEVLPGEVQFKHPHRDKMLRGQMVELKLEDRDSATDDVLFVGHRPLLI